MNDKKAKAEKMKVVSTVFEKCSVRVILDKNGNPWWVARDLAEPLDYKNIEVLLAIRRIGKYSVMGESNKFLENMLRTVQVQHSKDVAGKFYEAVGREGLQHYFGRSHRAATGCSLRERQAWARGEKLPSRKRTPWRWFLLPGTSTREQLVRVIGLLSLICLILYHERNRTRESEISH